MTDSKQQRINMVESQVRPSDVTDRRIIRAMLEVPREAFVPAPCRRWPTWTRRCPRWNRPAAGPARFLLAPRTFAKIVQLAEIGPDAVVLDVGCATGYSTAVLARLAKAVVAIEVDAALATRATQTLRQLGVGNAPVIEGALEKGAPSHAPFDAIVLEGAVPRVPGGLLEQLKDGGRLVAVIADGTFGRAQLWRRTGKLFDPRPAFDAGARAAARISRGRPSSSSERRRGARSKLLWILRRSPQVLKVGNASRKSPAAGVCFGPQGAGCEITTGKDEFVDIIQPPPERVPRVDCAARTAREGNA